MIASIRSWEEACTFSRVCCRGRNGCARPFADILSYIDPLILVCTVFFLRPVNIT